MFYIIMIVVALLNALFAIFNEKSNRLSATLGWSAVALWLILIIHLEKENAVLKSHLKEHNLLCTIEKCDNYASKTVNDKKVCEEHYEEWTK